MADPRQVYYSLKADIDAAADFTEYTLGRTTLTSDMIQTREMRVAIPSSTTPTQWQEINRAIAYGKSRGVKVIVTQTR